MTIVKIPDHDDGALEVLEDHGIHIFDFAKFLNSEKTKILAYKRCGKGFSKTNVELLRAGADG
jgi:hypothetical protein